METQLALIGFGEAGSTFAREGRWGQAAVAFDIVPSRMAAAGTCGVRPADSAAQALAEAPLVLSLVTADAALGAAKSCAPYLRPGTLWCDMNSVSPDTKRTAAKVIETVGAVYVDVAVMAPVNPQRLSVPLLLSGGGASRATVALKELGFDNMRVVGDSVGRASTIKMLRSVMYKGVEALTAECLIACERAGVTDEVLGSFGNDWASGADYRLDRMLVHGLRRAAEMREVCKTLEGLGLEPRMSAGAAAWQQAIGALALAPVPQDLPAKLEAITLAQKEDSPE